MKNTLKTKGKSLKLTTLGFTLIELLAVIVILAIIAVIAVPIVINIIEDTKINSVKSSANMYLKAAELFTSNAELNKVKINPGTYPITKDGDICIGIIEEGICNGEKIVIEIKGSKPDTGQIIISEKNIQIDYLEIDGYIYYEYNDEYIAENVIKKSEETDDAVITLSSSKVPYLTNYRIYGNSVTETDTIQSVGDLVTDEANEHYGEYEIAIKVTGKNLFDVNDFIKTYTPYFSINAPTIKEVEGEEVLDLWGGVNAAEMEIKYMEGTFKEKTQYIVSYDMYDIRCSSNNLLGAGLVLYYTDGTMQDLHSDSSGRPEQVWKYNEFKTYYGKTVSYIILEYNTGCGESYIKNFQIEEGTKVTEYEPYKEETYSIYLDEPLRCIEEGCDYIDYNNGKVVRYIDENFNLLGKAKIENVDLPKIEINNGLSHIFIETDIKPSKVSVNYYK